MSGFRAEFEESVTLSSDNLTVSDVIDVVVELLAEEKGVSAEEMLAELTAGGEDLPIDSLLLQEILVRLEERLGVQLPDTVETGQSMASVHTFAQAIVDAWRKENQ